MSVSCKFERSLLSHEEDETIRATHHPAIYEHDPEGLKTLRVRLRQMRDKERTLTRQKQREVRGKAEPRGGSFPGTAEHPLHRKQVFAAALKRVNKELSRVHKLEARTANSEAAWRALALRRAAQFAPYPPAGDTAGEGMRATPEPAAANERPSGQDRQGFAGDEGRAGRARLAELSGICFAPRSRGGESAILAVGRCPTPTANAMPRSSKGKGASLQENVIPSRSDSRLDTRPSNQGAIRDHAGHRCALRALRAEHRAHRCGTAVFRARHLAPVRLAVAAADPRAAFDVLVRRRDRARRRRAAGARSFHPAGGADHVGRNGIRLFHQPRAGRLFPDPQPRRRRHSLLLHLSLYRVRRRRQRPWGVSMH